MNTDEAYVRGVSINGKWDAIRGIENLGLLFEGAFFKPPNSTVPTTLSPCSIGVIPKPLLE